MRDYQESVTIGQTHRQTHTCRTKWSLCAAMLRRQHNNKTDTGKSDPRVPLCFAGDTITRQKPDKVIPMCHYHVSRDYTRRLHYNNMYLVSNFTEIFRFFQHELPDLRLPEILLRVLYRIVQFLQLRRVDVSHLLQEFIVTFPVQVFTNLFIVWCHIYNKQDVYSTLMPLIIDVNYFFFSLSIFYFHITK